MKLCLMEWEDTASYGDKWLRKEEAMGNKTYSIISIGVVLVDGDKEIKLVQSLSCCDSDCHNEVVIPRGCIKRMRQLKVAPTKASRS